MKDNLKNNKGLIRLVSKTNNISMIKNQNNLRICKKVK